MNPRDHIDDPAPKDNALTTLLLGGTALAVAVVAYTIGQSVGRVVTVPVPVFTPSGAPRRTRNTNEQIAKSCVVAIEAWFTKHQFDDGPYDAEARTIILENLDRVRSGKLKWEDDEDGLFVLSDIERFVMKMKRMLATQAVAKSLSSEWLGKHGVHTVALESKPTYFVKIVGDGTAFEDAQSKIPRATNGVSIVVERGARVLTLDASK